MAADGEGEVREEIDLPKELEKIMLVERKVYPAYGSSSPNVFAYLPKGVSQLVAERVSELDFRKGCGYVFGWVEGKDWEFLRDSPDAVQYEKLDYLRHNHDGCTECLKRDADIDDLEYRLDKERFGVKGMRERLNIFLESREPLEANGAFPFFAHFRYLQRPDVNRFMRLQAPDLLTLFALERLYGKAVYVAVGKQDLTPYTDEQTEEEQEQLPKVIIYPALAATHEFESETLAHTPHISIGKFNTERKSFIFEKHGA